MKKPNKPRKDGLIWCLKYLPSVVFLLAIAHITELMLNIRMPIFEITEVCIGFFLIGLISRRLGFCWRHRLMIYYAAGLTACNYFHRHIGFGEVIGTMHLIAFIMGYAILIIVIIEEIWKRTRKNSSKH